MAPVLGAAAADFRVSVFEFRSFHHSGTTNAVHSHSAGIAAAQFTPALQQEDNPLLFRSAATSRFMTASFNWRGSRDFRSASPVKEPTRLVGLPSSCPQYKQHSNSSVKAD
jgi:hypothetical protein